MRDWTCDRKDLYVVTGPIYDDDDPDTIGSNDVAVPSAFYKLAFEPRQTRAIAFILPNDQVPRRKRAVADVLADFVVTPGEVEKRAGIRLFTALAPRDRRRLLGSASPVWGVVKGCAQ